MTAARTGIGEAQASAENEAERGLAHLLEGIQFAATPETEASDYATAAAASAGLRHGPTRWPCSATPEET